MSKERKAYEFSHHTKHTVRKEQHGKCAITGKKRKYLETHHLLPIAIATGFWPNIDPEILKQRENAVAVCPEVHKQIHKDLHEWPKEFFKAYIIGLYCYLRDELNEAYEVAAAD